MAEIWRYKYMPFELYFNSHTNKWHLIKHLGKCGGRAHHVCILGRYKERSQALKVYNRLVTEAMK